MLLPLRPRCHVSQLLFAAFSNRPDAVELAHQVGDELLRDGITSEVYLLDSNTPPSLDAATVVVSLGGDGTFLKTARLEMCIRDSPSPVVPSDASARPR